MSYACSSSRDLGLSLSLHRYGSVIATHLLKKTDIARQIAAVILVDPISILLNQPDVAYNFVMALPVPQP